jgi:hypothetical protein
MDAAESWLPFFESAAALTEFSVAAALKELSMVDDADVEPAGNLTAAVGPRIAGVTALACASPRPLGGLGGGELNVTSRVSATGAMCPQTRHGKPYHSHS